VLFVASSASPAKSEVVAQENFQVIFEQLKPILRQHEAGMTVTADTATDYALDCTKTGPNGKLLFFGAVQVKKNYVSFHLMPVYMHPYLLDDISPALKKRMQGKSCFNFKTVDPALFDELRALTERGLASIKQA
jgi:hypothetical protein